MNRYALIIAYDGFNYSGWQSQKNTISIQTIIQNAISTILQEKIIITGSGRTDAKVHALGQTAHFDTEKDLCEKSFLISLNSLLPSDIKVIKIYSVSSDFHARYSAIKKTYHYYICTNNIILPHLRKTHLHIKEPFKIDLIKEAGNHLIGEHDFTSFTNVGSSAKIMVKTIYEIECIKTDVGYFFKFNGTGFLYKMVRNIVGLLLAVNKGKIQLDHIKSILEGKDRKLAPAPAPAHGLFLMKVEYPKQFELSFLAKNKELQLPALILGKKD